VKQRQRKMRHYWRSERIRLQSWHLNEDGHFVFNVVRSPRPFRTHAMQGLPDVATPLPQIWRT